MFDHERLRVCKTKPRVFIISDISNEPDDAESLVRYLLYSNEFDTRGLVACTSTWMKHVVHPEDMQKIVRAYAKVVDNLNQHVHPENQYSSAEHFMDMIKTGPAVYGKEALIPGFPLSEGAKLLVQRLQETVDPLWLLCWGGTNVLAQALQHIRHALTANEAVLLRSRLRVYAISDQDDTGVWIRQQFPDVFYISSLHGWNQYGLATWTGISGDKFYGFDRGGPDFSKITKEWVREHIQIGPLGEAYPDYLFAMEGDTPTFLYLIQNGLGSPEHPHWGSWGGRYALVDPGGASKHYSDVTDNVIGANGELYRSNHATIWRWRDAYQNDFAARMQWTLTNDPTSCNHAPIAIINRSTPGPEPVFLDAEAGSDVILDASESYDPDGDLLTFTWYQYKDISATQSWVDAEVADTEIRGDDGSNSKITLTIPPPEKSAVDLFTGKAQEKGQILHFILILKDDGTPSLTTYKRVVVQVTNKDLRGGRATVSESIADAHMSV